MEVMCSTSKVLRKLNIKERVFGENLQPIGEELRMLMVLPQQQEKL